MPRRREYIATNCDGMLSAHLAYGARRYFTTTSVTASSSANRGAGRQWNIRCDEPSARHLGQKLPELQVASLTLWIRRDARWLTVMSPQASAACRGAATCSYGRHGYSAASSFQRGVRQAQTSRQRRLQPAVPAASVCTLEPPLPSMMVLRPRRIASSGATPGPGHWHHSTAARGEIEKARCES